MEVKLDKGPRITTVNNNSGAKRLLTFKSDQWSHEQRLLIGLRK